MTRLGSKSHVDENAAVKTGSQDLDVCVEALRVGTGIPSERCTEILGSMKQAIERS